MRVRCKQRIGLFARPFRANIVLDVCRGEEGHQDLSKEGCQDKGCKTSCCQPAAKAAKADKAAPKKKATPKKPKAKKAAGVKA